MAKKFISTLSIVFALALGLKVQAQELTGKAATNRIAGTSRIVFKENNEPSFVNFESGQGPKVSEFGLWLKKNLGYSSAFGLSPIGLEKDKLGFEHLRYLQTYNGYPINHSMLIVHAKGSEVISFNGDLAPKQIAPAKQNISFSQSIEAAKKHVGASVYKWELPSQEQFIRNEQHDEKATFVPSQEILWTKGKGKGGDLELAYRLNIYAHEPMSRQYVFVSTASGEVLGTENLIHHADVNGTAITGFSGTQTITTDFTGTNYRLRETSRGLGVETYNLQKTTTYANTDFVDDDNTWNNVNANLDQYATDAHLGTEKTYDYFFTKFNRNSIDNLGFKLLSYVHYSTNYVNAFWDGNRMTYGDGNASYRPLTSIDVAAHEVTHGLTSKTANLVYSYESGAMNEGFSDIFGTAIEFYNGVNADWLIGEDFGSPFRSMSNPNLYNQPDTYLGTAWYAGAGDNGGVHYNSGVLNYWFYLLSVGGSGTNDKGNAFNVSAIGIDKAAAIAYRMLTVYLTSNSQYANARVAAIQSATDLYGTCSVEATQTLNAMYAVGIGSSGASAPTIAAAGPLAFCNGGSVALTASAGASAYQWNRDGSPISGATSATYNANASGNYTVTGTLCSLPLTSTATTVAVSTATASISPTGSVSNCTGSAIPLTANTSAGYSIQWNKDGSPISGANSSTYSATSSGNYTVTISGTTVPASSFSTSTAAAIPDNSCTGASSPITVSGLGTSIQSSGVSVKINMTHPWVGDLKFFIEAPNGDLLALANSNGSSGDNFTNTIFSDAATTNISAGVAPFTGTFKPIGVNFTVCTFTTTKTTFASLGGGTINPNGTWKLRVYDQGAADLGTIDNWQIDFPAYSSPSPNCGPVTSSATSVSIGSAITPTISASGPTTFCEGSSVTLTSSAATGNVWSNGATTQSIVVSTSGSYTVTANQGTCSASSSATGVTVNPSPSLFTISGGGAYCSSPGTGSVVSLSGSQSGVSYDFRFTATGSAAIVAGTGSAISAPITGTGTIFVVATNSTTTCSRSMNGSASVYPQAATTWYIDNDGDGFGNASSSTQACTQPAGYVSNSTDCNDGNNAVNTDATEICGNGIDDNCNGTTDENCILYTWYQDLDGDGFGNPAVSTSNYIATAPAGYVSNSTDCNDGNNAVYPSATEICGNGIDDNCNGTMDENCTVYTWYQDLDGDGFGNPAVSTSNYVATAPAGYVSNSTDCNDGNNAVYPSATEICGNGIDDNCNGTMDENCTVYTWYEDLDADGYGNLSVSTTTFVNTAPAGYVSNSTDCNDGNNAVYPGATEICGNGIDDNCNGTMDENCTVYTWYQDLDGDGFGNLSVSTTTFVNTAPAGYVSNSTDCNDGNNAVYPGATEVCNGIDDNCDGSIDNGLPALPTIASINGLGSVCKSTSGVVYSVDPVAGATSYLWTLPSGATGSSTTNSITVAFSATFAGGSICVTPRTNCVTGSQRCLILSIVSAKPAQPGAISGTTAGSCSTVTKTFMVVPVSGATSYNWTAPANSSVLSGQGTNSIVLQFAAGFTTGTLSLTANNCLGASTARTLALSNVTAAPTTLTGPATAVCAGSVQTYSTTAVSGATVYTWTVPTGATITSGQGSTSISVTFPSPYTSGAVTVKSGTSCYTSAARSLTVYSVPVAPASITGTAIGVCGGSTQTYTCPVSTTGASSYTWAVPAGATINSGQGSNSISVTLPAVFATGNVTVLATNTCGNSTVRSLAIRSTLTSPGTITGTSTNLCAGGSFNYSIAAVTGASGYSWTAPTGCSFIGNSTGISVNLSVPSGFVSGTLSVVANNTCGASTARTLALSGIPSTPASVTGPVSVCPSAAGLVYTTPAVSGVTTYTWTVPTGASVTAGAGTNSITAKWGTVAGSVTVKAGNACGTNATARSLSVALAVCRSAVEEEVTSATPSVKIYPNPGHGRFQLDATNIPAGTILKVSDLLGKEILNLNIEEGQTEINLDKVPAGAYFFQFQGADFNKIMKVIKQ